jgi:hypothetical protein
MGVEVRCALNSCRQRLQVSSASCGVRNVVRASVVPSPMTVANATVWVV